MEKEKYLISPCECICWAIAGMAFFGCFLTVGTFVTFVALILEITLFCFFYKGMKNDYSDGAMLLFGYLFVFGFSGSIWYGFTFVAAYAVVIALKRKVDLKNVLGMHMCLIVMAFFTYLFGFHGNYVEHQRLYSYYLGRVDLLKDDATSHDMDILKNPYLFSQAIDSLCDKEKKNSLALKKETDSLKKELWLLQDKSKPQILKIKRVWLNSDVRPWTYQAYTSIHLSMNSGLFYNSTNLSINGNGEYTGDSRVDYINIVFSDNSFHQFKVKESPEWLLAKEGDFVKIEKDNFFPLFKK